MTMRYFRKLPVIIGAEQWFPGKRVEGVCENSLCASYAHIHTLEGVIAVSYGDWVIRGVKGEHYPCRDDIFKLTYEPVEDING